MSDFPFNHPEARRKRSAELEAETSAVLSHYANRLNPRTAIVRERELKTGTTYFVGPVDGPIKIGFATRLEFRLRDLRLMNPLPLIVHATVEGPATIERAYHNQFAAHRLHGEWFEPHPDILAEIDRLTQGADSE